MEDIVAIVMIFGTMACGLIAYSPIGRALADRIRGRKASMVLDEQAVLAELEALRHDVAELQERSDFAERLLARGTEPGSA